MIALVDMPPDRRVFFSTSRTRLSTHKVQPLGGLGPQIPFGAKRRYPTDLRCLAISLVATLQTMYNTGKRCCCASAQGHNARRWLGTNAVIRLVENGPIKVLHNFGAPLDREKIAPALGNNFYIAVSR